MDRSVPAIYQAPLASLQFSLNNAARARESAARCACFAEVDDTWLVRVAAWQRSVAFWRRAAALDLTRLL